MAKKKYKTKEVKSEVSEPQALGYWKNRIVFFKSFEEENEYVAKERAALSYEQRMFYIEELRKRIFNNYLVVPQKVIFNF